MISIEDHLSKILKYYGAILDKAYRLLSERQSEEGTVCSLAAVKYFVLGKKIYA